MKRDDSHVYASTRVVVPCLLIIMIAVSCWALCSVRDSAADTVSGSSAASTREASAPVLAVDIPLPREPVTDSLESLMGDSIESSGSLDSQGEYLELAGAVIDQGRPLTLGHLVVMHPSRGQGSKYADIVVDIGEDGRFSCLLPVAEYGGRDHVMVNIDDDRSILYSGLVRVQSDARIHVVSTANDPFPLAGTIQIPAAGVHDRWWVTLFSSKSGTGSTDIATSGLRFPLVGQSASVRMMYQYPLFRNIDGAVVLVVKQIRGSKETDGFYRMTLGHKCFSSQEDFRQKLAAGIPIDSPRRTIRIYRSEAFSRVWLQPIDCRSAVYPCRVMGEGLFEVLAPDGEYRIVGRAKGKVSASADLVLEPNIPNYRVRWINQTPGPHTVLLQVADEEGQAMEGMHVSVKSINEGIPIHGGRTRSLTDAAGEVEISGLLPMRYAFHVRDSEARIQGVALVTVPTEEAVRVVVREFGVAEVRLVGAAEFGLDSIDVVSCTIWFRALGAAEWQELAVTKRRAGAWAIRSLRQGIRYQVAVQGPWWSGSGIVTADGGGPAPALVRIVPVVEVTGHVQLSNGTHVAGCAVHVSSGAIDMKAGLLPSERSKTDSTGRFMVRIPVDSVDRAQLSAVMAGVGKGTCRIGSGSKTGIAIVLSKD